MQRVCLQVVCSSAQVAEVAVVQLPQQLPPTVLLALAGIAIIALAIKKLLDTPSRKYDPNNPNVGQSYDTWEQYVPATFLSVIFYVSSES